MLFDLALGILIGVLLIVIVALFCLILVRLYITKIKSYTAQLYQKDLDFQKTLTQTVVETQEQVLQDISQDLHDDAGQQLTYINFQIESLRLDSAQYNTSLEPLSEAVKKLSVSIRSLSHSLSNHLLMGHDLVKAIESEGERLQNMGRIKVSFSLEAGFKKVFDANEKTVLYRIFQEVMNNIVKHSNATFVKIAMADNPFEIIISDDGNGFETSAKSGLGLSNMLKRAESIQYSVSLESVPGTGTIVRIYQAV